MASKSNSSSMKIGKGDRVRITGTRAGWTIKGIVKTASNYGTQEPRRDDWYIELNDDLFGYVYWKQSIDGGTVSKESN